MLADYSGEEILLILDLAKKIKSSKNLFSDFLKGKSLALLFDKPSTRTRLSFEAGIAQLGGNAIYLGAETMQIKRGETLEDTAKIMNKYLDGLVIRTFMQEAVEIFAAHCCFPVINGLTDYCHPCQVISDLFTISELGLLGRSLKFVYLGDCNNVLNSLLSGFIKLGLDITVGCSPMYEPEKKVMELSLKEASKTGSSIKLVYDPYEAVKGADIIYTDVWVSMGESHSGEKIKELSKFQVNRKLLSFAKPEARVMHCLPAHRDQEITSEVLDSNAGSTVWQQAENRLHAQKALLVYLYAGI
jgi:ornithine carbamoyltransferase